MADPRYPRGEQGPTVETRLPAPAQPRNPATDFTVRPEGQRPAVYGTEASPAPAPAPAAAAMARPVLDPRFSGGQQGPSVSTRLPAPVNPATSMAVRPESERPPLYGTAMPAPAAPATPAAATMAQPTMPAGATPGPANPANPAAAAAGIIEGQNRPPVTTVPTVKPVLGKPQVQAAAQLASGMMPNTQNVMRGYGEDASAAVDAGHYGAAAGHLVRGTAAMIPALVDDTVGAGFRAAAPAVSDFAGAVLGGNAQAQPAGGTMPKPAATGKPGSAGAAPGGAQAGGPDRANPPNAQAQPAPPPVVVGAIPQLTGERANTAVAGAPGAHRITGPDGRTMYSNVPGTTSNDALQAGGGVNVLPGQGSPSRGAAATLATSIDPALQRARAAAVARGDIEAVRASYGGDFAGGGQAQNPVIAQLTGDIAGGRRLTARGAQTYSEAQRVQAGERQGDAATANAATRLALEAPGMAADAQVKEQQALAGQQVTAAQAAYQKAATPEAREAALDNLRALQGKYEKSYPELFATSILPGQVDALGNKTPGMAVVTNKRDGTVKLYNQDGAAVEPGGKTAAQPLPSKDQLKAGTTYQTSRGPAKWDGKQFVPAQQ